MNFKAKKGKVTIIMSPVHAWQIQAIDIANLFNEFKEWKKTICFDGLILRY